MKSMRPQQRVKSAYFSEENSTLQPTGSQYDTSIETPGDRRKQQSFSTIFTNERNVGATQFPNQRAVLWNRSNYGNATVLSPSSVLPALRICSQSVGPLIQQLYSRQEGVHSPVSEESMLVLLGYLESTASLSDQEFSSLSHCCPSSASPEHFVVSIALSSEKQQQREEFLKIPVSMRSTHDYNMLFEEGTTRNLMNNLGKGLYKGKSFSLRSCMRLRAAARVHCTGPEGRGRITTPLRLEVITPNLSFEAVQVGTIPIFTTASTSKLLEDQSRSNMGYITLNQTRQLVLLPSSSDLASINCEVITAPVVGVWVTIPAMEVPLDFLGQQGGEEHSHDTSLPPCPLSVLQNPYVWGACVKYILTEHIQDKVWVAPSTFLLTLFATFGVFHFEIKSLSKTLPLSLEHLTYSCQEFSVDLNGVEGTARSRTMTQSKEQTHPRGRGLSELHFVPYSSESVIGKLRSSVTSSYQSLFSTITPPFSSSPAKSISVQQDAEQTEPQPQQATQQSPTVDRRSKEIVAQAVIETSSTSLSEIKDTSLLTAQSVTSSVYYPPKRNTILSQSDFVPLEAYLAQQKEIEQLRAQVELLQQQLAKPVSSPATASSPHLQRSNQFENPLVRSPVVESSQEQNLSGGSKQDIDTDRSIQKVDSDSDSDCGSDLDSSTLTASKYDEKSYGNNTFCKGDVTLDNYSSILEEKEEEDESNMSVQFIKETFQPLEAPSLFDFDRFINTTDKKQPSKLHNTNSNNGTLLHKSSPLDALLPVAPPSTANSSRLSQRQRHSSPLAATQDSDDVICTAGLGSECKAQQYKQHLDDDESEVGGCCSKNCMSYCTACILQKITSS